MNERIIVFAPHPDDETFGCGGLIPKRLSENYEVSVVVLTDGKYAYQVLFGIDSEPNVFRRNMVHVDISKFLSLKETALREFKSEITVMSRKQQRPIMENIESFLKDRETFFIDR